MTINNINDFSTYLGIEVDDLEKAIYKGTACGAWINWDEKEIRIGPIVEGSDAEFECDPLVFPFDSEDFEQALIWLESETERAWRIDNPDMKGIAAWIDNLLAFDDKPDKLYTIEDAETDLEEHRKYPELFEDDINLWHVDAEDYMEAMNYNITNVWKSLKEE